MANQERKIDLKKYSDKMKYIRQKTMYSEDFV